MTVPTASRGRRASADPGSKSGRTRERIVAATARVLNTRGYAGTRLSDIAGLAEVAAPAIYYYFSSREDLIEEAVSEGLARATSLVGDALAAVADDADPMHRIELAVEAHLTTLLTHSDHAAAAMRTVDQLPPDIRERQLVAQRAYIDLWRGLLADAYDAGALDPGIDRRVALMIVLNALNGTVSWWDAESGSLPNVVETAQAIIRKGLSAP